MFGGGDSTPKSLQIDSFKIEVSKNTMLNKDVQGTINGNSIYIVLPYDVLDNNTPLLASISVPSESTISPDPTVPISFRAPVVYMVKRGADYKTYTVYSSIDPDSLTFLRVADPFYVDASGTETPIATYSLKSNTGAISLDLNTGDYSIMSNRPIGFKTIYYGYNSVVSPVIVYGNVMPYNVTVSSKDGTQSRAYNLTLNRNTVTETDLVSVTANCQKIYDKTITSSSNIADYNSFLNEAISGSSSLPNKIFIQSSATFYPGSASVTYSNNTGLSQNSFYNSQIVNFPTTSSASIIYSDPFDTTTASLIHNSYQYSPPVGNSTTDNSLTFQFFSTFDVSVGSSGGTSLYKASFSSRSFTFIKTTTTSFVSRNYYKFISITCIAPAFCHFECNYISSTCTSYTTNGTTLTFVFKDFGADKIFGIVGIFDIVAESGSSKTYFINITEN